MISIVQDAGQTVNIIKFSLFYRNTFIQCDRNLCIVCAGMVHICKYKISVFYVMRM